MTMTQTRKTFVIEPSAIPLEALYPREGFIQTENGYKPVFLGHPSARCDICEAPFRKTLQHPASQYEGLVEICGGHLMRLTEAKAS